MPLSSNPNATAEFWLSSDADIPIEKRPVFKVRFLTEAQHQEHQRLMQEASAGTDNATAYAKVAEAIALGVVGWDHFVDQDGKSVPWTSNNLMLAFQRARLTERELWYLAWNYPIAVRLAAADRPLSASQPDSAGDASAQSAPKPDAA